MVLALILLAAACAGDIDPSALRDRVAAHRREVDTLRIALHVFIVSTGRRDLAPHTEIMLRLCSAEDRLADSVRDFNSAARCTGAAPEGFHGECVRP